MQAAGRCYGRTDLLLADPQDGEALAAQLRPLGGAVWSSPAARCRVVAGLVGPHQVDGRLAELDFGAWEGMHWDDVPLDALDRWAADPVAFAPPGGESGGALIARIRQFCAGLPEGDHVVISHGGPLKVLAALLRGESVDLLAPAPGLGSVTIV